MTQNLHFLLLACTTSVEMIQQLHHGQSQASLISVVSLSPDITAVLAELGLATVAESTRGGEFNFENRRRVYPEISKWIRGASLN